MKFKRRRSSLLPRPDWRALHAPRVPLAGQAWFRGEARSRREVDPGDAGRRLAAGATGGLLLMVLIGLLVLPPLRIREVTVHGAGHLASAEVVRMAGLDHPSSIFLVDAGAVQARVDANPWVRSARVEASLPGRVEISVEEWRPVATFRAGDGAPWYLSDQAIDLGPVAAGGDPSGLLDIRGPAAPQPRQGRRALDVQLLVALVNIQRGLPGLIDQQVRSFRLDGCGNLTMVAGRGWEAQFGRVLTPEEFRSLQDKVASLRALAVAGSVDFNSPRLQYVNLMNASSPAVGQATPAPKPAPAAAASAVPTPAPPATPQNGPSVVGPSAGTGAAVTPCG